MPKDWWNFSENFKLFEPCLWKLRLKGAKNSQKLTFFPQNFVKNYCLEESYLFIN